MATSVKYSPELALEEVDVTELTRDKDVIKIYANGFQCQLTLADANIVVKQNNASLAVITMTLSAAKSLHAQLARVMDAYEKDTGHRILSFEELIPKKYIDKESKK